MQLTTARPAPDHRTKRPPRWWWIVLVQLAGTYTAGLLALLAWFSLPDNGLFGVPNDDGTQAMGALAALGSVVCMLSGPLLVALVRRDRRSLKVIGWIAGGVAMALLAALSG